MSETHLERVRRICLGLPEAAEKEAWGAPTFRIRKRLFAMYHDNHHGDGRIALWVNAPEGAQGMLVEAAPERIFVPPYMGPSGWIGLHLDRMDDAEVEVHVRQSYLLAAPKRLVKQLEEDGS